MLSCVFFFIFLYKKTVFGILPLNNSLHLPYIPLRSFFVFLPFLTCIIQCSEICPILTISITTNTFICMVPFAGTAIFFRHCFIPPISNQTSCILHMFFLLTHYTCATFSTSITDMSVVLAYICDHISTA